MCRFATIIILAQCSVTLFGILFVVGTADDHRVEYLTPSDMEFLDMPVEAFRSDYRVMLGRNRHQFIVDVQGESSYVLVEIFSGVPYSDYKERLDRERARNRRMREIEGYHDLKVLSGARVGYQLRQRISNPARTKFSSVLTELQLYSGERLIRVKVTEMDMKPHEVEPRLERTTQRARRVLALIHRRVY